MEAMLLQAINAQEVEEKECALEVEILLMLSDFEKFLYNKYLSCTKKAQNKPYTLRKDFSNIDSSTAFYLKKLSLFFNKFKQIKIDDFFGAPFGLHKDEKYIDLKFYISPKAVNMYNMYKKQKETQDPDTTDNLKHTASSLKFIKNYCSTHNIHIKDYLNFTENTNTLPAFVGHLQSHDVNFYSLMGFNDFMKQLTQNFETHKFVLGDVIDNIHEIYSNFVRSKKLKVLVREGIKKIA
jgi:hypothetical protein